MEIDAELVHKFSMIEWFESVNSHLGRPHYVNRPSYGELYGVPGVMPPKVFLKQDYDRDMIEVWRYIYPTKNNTTG